MEPFPEVCRRHQGHAAAAFAEVALITGVFSVFSSRVLPFDEPQLGLPLLLTLRITFCQIECHTVAELDRA